MTLVDITRKLEACYLQVEPPRDLWVSKQETHFELLVFLVNAANHQVREEDLVLVRESWHLTDLLLDVLRPYDFIIHLLCLTSIETVAAVLVYIEVVHVVKGLRAACFRIL